MVPVGAIGPPGGPGASPPGAAGAAGGESSASRGARCAPGPVPPRVPAPAAEACPGTGSAGESGPGCRRRPPEAADRSRTVTEGGPSPLYSGATMARRSKTHLLLFGASLISAVTALVVFRQFAENERALAAAERTRLETYRLSDVLRQTSDDLTRMARLYSVTGDPRYRHYFREILEIRAGEAPRPADYYRIYWDLVLEDDERPRPSGDPESLDAMAAEAGFTEVEFALLRESENNSDVLAELEQTALLAETPPELDEARGLLHSPRYHQEKARIMRPLNEVQGAAESRTAAAVAHHEGRRGVLSTLLLILIGLSGLLALVGFARKDVLIAS